MTMSLPPNFENKSNNHSDSIDALEAKILGLRAVIQYLKEQKSSPEKIAMKKAELEELEAQHYDLVIGDDDAIVSSPDDEGDASVSKKSQNQPLSELEKRLQEIDARTSSSQVSKAMGKGAKVGMGLVAAALGGTGLYLAAPKNTPVTPTPLETQSTAPNPEQRQAPTISSVENSADQSQAPALSGVENSAEQINIPINIDYRSLDGNLKTMNVGNVVSTTGEQKLAYEKMLAGKGCVILGGQIINGESSIQIVVLGGMQLEFFTQFADGGHSILPLNYTSELPEHNIYVYTFHEKPLKTTPMLFSDGSRNLFLKNNSTITIQTPLQGVRVPLASMQYASPF
jgi:hypothetical protein